MQESERKLRVEKCVMELHYKYLIDCSHISYFIVFTILEVSSYIDYKIYIEFFGQDFMLKLHVFPLLTLHRFQLLE